MIAANDSSERLRCVVRRIVRLPTLPASVLQIQTLMRNANVSAAVVGQAISRDPPLAAQALKLVNSGFYGFSRPIASISHAVVLLGFGTIKALLVSTAVTELMQRTFPGLYTHSLACARIAFLLGRRLGLDDPDELSTAALMHDIGKVVLADRLPDDFKAIADTVEHDNILFFEAETRRMGVTHAELGAWLLAKWRIPDRTAQAVGRHHSFNPNAPFAIHTAVLHLADILARAAGIGFAGDRRIPRPDPRAMELMEIGVADIQPIMDEAMDLNRDLLASWEERTAGCKDQP